MGRWVEMGLGGENELLGGWASADVRTAADGMDVGAREWLEMGREKEVLGMSELDARTAADRVGAREWVERGDEPACMRGRLRTAVGAREWVEMGRGDERAWMRAADGTREWVDMRSLDARTAADGVSAREWVEMGREKEPLGMSELGCADGCGRRAIERVEMGRENLLLAMSEVGCADGCGWHGCGPQPSAHASSLISSGSFSLPLSTHSLAREWVEMGREKEPLGMSELGCADRCGQRGCKGVGGNG
eukprot:s1409_g11.t1